MSDAGEHGDRPTADEIRELVGDEIVRDREERVRTSMELPKDVKEIINERSEQAGKPQWQIVAESIKTAQGGADLTTVSQIEQAIEREEQKAADLEREAEMLREQAQDRRDRADELRRRKAKIERETQARIDALDRLLDTMAKRGTHAAVGLEPVSKLAEEWFDGDQTEALSALKSRAVEIDAEIPPEQFSAPSAGTNTTSGQKQDDGSDLKYLQRLRGREREGEDEGENDQENEDEDEGRREDDGDAEPKVEPEPGPDQMAVPIHVRADGGER